MNSLKEHQNPAVTISTGLVIAFVAGLLLLFGGSMIGNASMGGNSWVWLPILLVVVLGAVLTSVIFDKKLR